MNERLLRGLSDRSNAPPERERDPLDPLLPAAGSDITSSLLKRLQLLEKDAKGKGAVVQQLKFENESLQRRVAELESELAKARTSTVSFEWICSSLSG